MTLNSGVYRIELGNGWFYIGSAVNLRKREREHRSGLKRGKHCNIKMQNVWNKHNTFEFTILEECAIDDLIIHEQIYLDKHFNDEKNVNICSTAGSTLGVIFPKKTHCPQGHAFNEINTYICKDNNRRCKECQKLRYISNKEVILVRQKIHHFNNREAILIRKKLFYIRNREAALASQKLYRKKRKQNV